MKITLLGVHGCPTCARLDANVKLAITAFGKPINVEKITDPDHIMSFEPGGLPAVLINGELKAVRRVPPVDELRGWLDNA